MEQAPFNSALDLLERLSGILTHIVKVKQNLLLSNAEKQEYVLELTKDYYVQAVPILSKDAREELRTILDVEQDFAIVVENGVATKRKKKIYSEKVQKNINETLINIQMDLQDVGSYFMPKRRDMRSIVSQF